MQRLGRLAVLPEFLLPNRDLAAKPRVLPAAPFVYRLGLRIFIPARGVRLPQGAPVFLNEQSELRKTERRSERRSRLSPNAD